ncbi:MAG TPA: ATP-binding protein [Candidatus Paceibacterota bacterium]
MDTKPQSKPPAYFQPAALARSGIHFVYAKLVRPKAETEDGRRREHILNIILVGFLALLSFFEVILLHGIYSAGSSFRGQSFLTFNAIVGLFVGLLVLSRKGYVRAAAYTLIALFILAASLGAYQWGINLPSSILMYVFAIVSAGILVSNRFAIITAALASVIVTALPILHSSELIQIDREWVKTPPQIADAIKDVVFFFAFVLIAWLSNRDTERSLIRARKSEAELKEERDSLEIKVQKRTAEIQRLQAEKISHMYRFVEFGRLSAGLFHDLINPLHSLALNMQSIDTSKKISSENLGEIKDEIDRSIDASRRMERYIVVLRKHLQTADHKEVFVINDNIEDALTIFNHKALKAGVELRFFASDKIAVENNPLKLQQVIGNLISNAIDSYATCDKRDKTVEIRLAHAKNQAVISVKDNGCGIPKQLLDKIFDPFFTTKAANKGMGIGLSTTKDIVEKYFNGTISIQGAEGKGSTFTVSFPLKSHHENGDSGDRQGASGHNQVHPKKPV